MKLSTRLTLAMVALVLVTTAVLGFLNYQNVVDLVMPRALMRLQTHAELNALLIDTSLKSTHADAVGAQSSSALRELLTARRDSIQSTGTEPENWRKRIEERFFAEMVAKPSCAVLRIIGPDDSGRELVRVDRRGPNGSIRAVAPSELSRRGDRAYFKDAMALPPKRVAMSKVELNNSTPTPDQPRVPTVRTMVPIDDADGTRLGILVINTDLRGLFERIRESSDGSSTIYVVNANGDYLLHPDRSREFGFDLGRPSRIQDDFPRLADLLLTGNAGEIQPTLVTDRAGARFGVGWGWTELPDGPRLAVVETRPYASLTSVQTAVRNSTVLGGTVAILVAMLMAFPLARSLTRPLVRITNSIVAFSSSGVPVEVKTGGGHEINMLADAFSRMASESQRKAVALASEVEQRSRIAEVLQNTIDNMVDPVLVADAGGMVILTNPAARETFGQLSGVGVLNTTRSFDRFDADGNPMVQDQSPLLRAYRGETIVNFEFAVQPIGSGRRSYLIANGRPLRNEAGEIQGAVMVYHDITKTKKAEEALRRSAQMSRAIIDTALDAFVQLDAQGRITDWSPHAVSLLGWSREEAIGQDFGELALAPDHNRDIKTGYRRFIEAIEHDMSVIQGHRIEVEAVRRDGSPIALEVSMTALPVEGRFVVNAFMRDLTEKIAFEEQLRQSQKMESIGQLTGGIAHDFNNMLTVITGTIDIISDGVADQPQLAAIAKLISEAADRGSELTRLLLAFARKQPLRPDETGVNALLAGLQSLLRPTLGERIEVETVLAPDTWPIYVDRGQLESALVNLAVNARDAMPKGGKLTIETSNVMVDPDLGKRLGDLAPGDYVMISITDSGSGIPEAIRNKVFDPFFTTKEVGKGTGLGLSMVYGFIKQSGGHITLDSEEGQGTTFRLYLPRAQAEVDADAAPSIEPNPVGGTETILVVEDDAMVRSYVNAQLKSLGYTTLSVSNAAAALSIGESDTAFDLLFTDVVMPGAMNGVQLAVEMAKLRPGLKVLYTSGYSENALIHNDRIDSDVLLLSKPYRRSDLARMIRRALTPGQEPEAVRSMSAAAESLRASRAAAAWTG
ncbi:PAS domain S-box protein [Rubrivivax sp. JA1024]|nr:PAS domain S-box protein [Rubrivivax sp. JA1024]